MIAWGLHWVESAAIGFLATVGFGVWFALPRETLPRAGVVGMGGFLLRTALVEHGHSPMVGSFFAAVFIGVFGYYRALSYRYPRVIFTVPGIIPLVPGIPAYRALLLISQGNVLGGLDSAMQGFLISAALAAGLAAARALTFRRAAESA
ncbi:MAG: threonine/serine exporter family protein [Polyangiaceae bacterium]